MIALQSSEFRVQSSEEKSSVNSFYDLKVWQRSRILCANIYKLTDSFPKTERYQLCSQLQRAAVSVPSNIAEGSSRRSTKEFIRFLNMAYGSLAEIHTQLLLASDLSFVSETDIAPLLTEANEIQKMMNGLISSLSQKLNSEL